MAFLEGKVLAVILVGTTHYVDIGKETDAVIYYPSETAAHMTLPGGPTWQGSLEIKKDGYFVNWNDGPQGHWKISYTPGKFTYIGPDGKAAGTISRIVPGNAEKF